MKAQRFTLQQIEKNVRLLKSCRSNGDVSTLLSCGTTEINLLSYDPLYYHFSIPKSNGGTRHIEAPEERLKKIQRKLNDYLQCLYYLKQTRASHGFIIKAKGNATRKDIYTNALAHLGCYYMMKLDFKDFFHQVSLKQVYGLFKKDWFSVDNHTAHVLAKLCCYKGRLPMGAPTSPALSNLYTIPLDRALTVWAIDHGIIYTRYVDDLTFSSTTHSLAPKDAQSVKEICAAHGLELNPAKTRYFGPRDEKKITGLVLKESVDIDTEYYRELDDDLLRLKSVIEVNFLTGNVRGLAFIRDFKQEVMGKIAFIAAIEGRQSPEYLTYLNRYHEALEPSEKLFVRWQRFSNYT